MAAVKPQFTVNQHFERKNPAVRQTYDQILKALKRIGPVAEAPKKTSIHLMHHTTLAGVATRKDYLILTIKSDRKPTSPRVFKIEHTSAARYYHQVKLASPDEVDEELVGWLKTAYALSA